MKESKWLKGKIIEAIYDKGVFRPLQKVRLKPKSKVVIILKNTYKKDKRRRILEKTFGILKNKNLIRKILKEIEDEWGVC